ncbi:MAG: hypothetical protein A3B70_07220 [Deltaproteobacteria bacterium RIFCSPHIGHO2_02_FULL_40_11]|nr:MAG: hypothetical protein A3B70_07220 [Deltaproteobacteria bacterium RIFCSPHIGHO2_02_FULL_40_11]
MSNDDSFEFKALGTGLGIQPPHVQERERPKIRRPSLSKEVLQKVAFKIPKKQTAPTQQPVARPSFVRLFFKTLCAITLDHVFVFLMYGSSLTITVFQLEHLSRLEFLELLSKPFVFYAFIGLLVLMYVFYYGFFILFKLPTLGRLLTRVHTSKN